MTEITFRPAKREGAPVLLAFAGPSGGGKTYTALRVARGLVGPSGRIAGIDTEARRMLHYAGKFQFDHAEFAPPFTPERLLEHVEAAERHVGRGGAIVIDSASHEYAGDGGLQEMHGDELDKIAKGNPARMEALTAPAWKEPKKRHKKMMSRLLQCRAHLIFCLRAEEKIKFQKVVKQRQDGQGTYEATVIVPIGWQPICERNFMFEMTCSFMLADTVENKATVIKCQEQHRAYFPTDKPFDEACGAGLAAWASGGDGAPVNAPAATVSPPMPSPNDLAGFDTEAAYRYGIESIMGLDNSGAIKTFFVTDRRLAKLKASDPDLYEQLRLEGVRRQQELKRGNAAL